VAADNGAYPAIVSAAAHARALLDGDAAMLVDAAAHQPHPWAEASALEDAGAVLAGRGHQASNEQFERALAVYQQIGAERDASRVRSRLRGAGVSPRRRRRAATGWNSLTDTEKAVSEAVAEGLTNRQVAGRMFLSPHTVDFHLRQIFRKLDIHSRVQLARLTLQQHRTAGEPSDH
jgi:DNA-binding CsgD family transcriptional regulator